MKINLEEWIKKREEELVNLALDRQTLKLIELVVVAAEKRTLEDEEYVLRDHEEEVLQKVLGIIFTNYIGSIDGKKYLLEKGNTLPIHGRPEEQEIYLNYETRIRTIFAERQKRIGKSIKRQYEVLLSKKEVEGLNPEESEKLSRLSGALFRDH